MRTAKQDELDEKHGTPEQFEKAIWKAYADLFITHEEATSAIRRYQAEWDAASTGFCTANAPVSGGTPSAQVGCSADVCETRIAVESAMKHRGQWEDTPRRHYPPNNRMCETDKG